MPLHPPRPIPLLKAGAAPPLALLAVLVISGCGETFYYSPLGASPRALSPRPVYTVDTFAVSPPARPHIDVGLMEVVQGADPETTEEMLDALRAGAAEIGCDAVVITSIDHRRSKHPASVQASCVVYLEGSGTNNSLAAPVAADGAAQVVAPARTSPAEKTP